MPDKPEKPLVTLTDADEERIYILDAQQHRRLVAIKREYMVTDANGPRVVREMTLVQTADGRTIDPNKPIAIFDCPFCNRQNLSLYSIRYCETCQAVVCLQCAHAIRTPEDASVYCPNCCPIFPRDRLINFYLFNLTNKL
jgi:predicted RNA-binding Zn-ribbon protein involved in translation (DUF1610 family)